MEYKVQSNSVLSKKIVLLGSSGFIGKAIRRVLAQKGYKHVHPSSSMDCDLLDFQSIVCLLRKHSPDIVIGAYGLRREKLCNSGKGLVDYLSMSRFLFNALLTRSGIRYIHVSSDCVRDPRNLRESLHAQYIKSRILSESSLLNTLASNSPPPTIIRPTIVYGHFSSDDPLRPISLLKSAMDDERIYIWGNGHEIRNYIHVDDLARYIESCIHIQTDEPFITTAYNQSFAISSILSSIANITGRDLNIVYRKRTIPRFDFKPPNLIDKKLYETNLHVWLSKAHSQLKSTCNSFLAGDFQ